MASILLEIWVLDLVVVLFFYFHTIFHLGCVWKSRICSCLSLSQAQKAQVTILMCLGNDIDVYLRPLIDELNELWENGVNTYDVSIHINFQLKTVVIWTVNDFPAYDHTSGWSTKENWLSHIVLRRLFIVDYITVQKYIIWGIVDFCHWDISGDFKRGNLIAW